MAELRLKFTGDGDDAKRVSAEVRASVVQDLERIRQAAAKSFLALSGQAAKARGALASGSALAGDAESLKQYNDRLVQTRETLAKLQRAVRDARQEIAGSAQETASSTRRFEVLEETIRKLTARADELQTALQGGATAQTARQIDALGAAAERTNGTFLNTQARLKDVAAGSDALSVVVEEIRHLGEIIKGLEPGRIHSVVAALGSLGHAAQGLAAVKELGITVEHITRASIAVRGAATSAAAGAQTLFVAAKEKAAAGVSTLSESVSGLTARLPSLLTGLGAGGAGLVAIGAAAAVAIGALALVAAAVIGVVATFAALAVAIPVAVDLLQRIFDRGIAYNSQLEQTKLGIAAVVASLAELQTAQGKRLEGPEALNTALALAEVQLQKLKVDAINTTATFEQIAPAFQAAIGPGLRAGLTLDQIRETVVRITQAAGAVGVPFNQLNQEVRAILEGTINEDARLAKILGISNEQVKNWRQQGTLAEELNKRLEQFGAAGVRAAETLDGLTSNLQEALNVFTGQATERAFNVLKDRIARLLPQLFDFKAAGIDKSLQVLAEIIDDIFVRVINVAGDVAEDIIGYTKNIAGFLDQHRELVDAILQTAEEILRTIILFAKQIVAALSNTNDWRGVLQLVLGTLQVIKAVLISFTPLIQDATAAARILLALLIAANPFLVRLGAAAAQPAGPRVNQQDLDNEMERLRSKQAGVKVTASPAAPKIDKGAANRAHQEAVRRLEQEEREIEEVYRRETEALKREFDLQITSSRAFTKDIIDAANERFEGLKEVYKKELAEAKKQSEIDKIKNDQLKAERERDKVVQEAQDAQNKREIETLQKHREALLDLQDEYDARTIASIEARAELEAISNEEAEEKSFKIQTDAFDRRLQAARDDEARFYAQQKDINDANVELAEEYSDHIAAIVSEQEKVQQEHDARLEAARQKDLERQRAYQDKVFDLEKTYEEQDRETKKAEVERALRSPLREVRIQALSQRLALEIDEIDRRERLANKRLENDEKAAKKDYELKNQSLKGTQEYYDNLLLIEQTYQALRQQNKDKADQERKDATDRGNREAEALDPSSGFSLLGDVYADTVEKTGSILQGLLATGQDVFAQLSAQAGNMRDIMVDAFGAIGQAVGHVVQSFVLYGNAGGSFRKVAAQIIAAVASQAAVKSIFELAEGFAALARMFFGDPRAAAEAKMHFTAAAIYGTVAGVAAIAGRAAAGSSFQEGGGGGGGAGAAYEERQARNRELRYGNSQEPTSGARPGSVGAMMFDLLERAKTAEQRNAVLMGKLDTSLSRIQSMPAGEVVTMGAPDAREAIGVAVLTHSSADNDFNDTMASNIGLRR